MATPTRLFRKVGVMGMGLVGHSFTGDGVVETKGNGKLKWVKENRSVKFNERVRDMTTGFEGIVNAKCTYRTGCTHVEIQPTDLDKGKIRKSEWIDETLLEVRIEVKVKEKRRPKKRGPYQSHIYGGPGDGPPTPSRPEMNRPEVYEKREE